MLLYKQHQDHYYILYLLYIANLYSFTGITYTSGIGTTTPPSQTDGSGSTTPDNNSVGGLQMAGGGENAMDSTVSSPPELYPQQSAQPSTIPLIQQHQQQQQQQQQQLMQQQQNRYQQQRNYHHQQQHRSNGEYLHHIPMYIYTEMDYSEIQ